MFTLRSAIRPFDVIISATIPHLLPPLTRSLRKTKSIGPDQYYAWWPPNPQQHPNISRDPRGDGFDVSLRPLGLPGDRSIMELIPDLPQNNGQRHLIFSPRVPTIQKIFTPKYLHGPPHQQDCMQISGIWYRKVHNSLLLTFLIPNGRHVPNVV